MFIDNHHLETHGVEPDQTVSNPVLTPGGPAISVGAMSTVVGGSRP